MKIVISLVAFAMGIVMTAAVATVSFITGAALVIMTREDENKTDTPVES